MGTHAFASPVAITGANGLLGSELCRLFGDAALPLDISDVDLTHARRVRSTLRDWAPQLIINTAAYTQVDQAETESRRCFAVNRDAVRVLAETADRLGCGLVQISSDYIFSGTPPAARSWTERDTPAPQSVYAQSKWEGEQAAATIQRHLIVRTCGLYGQPGPRSRSNFVTTLLGQARRETTLRVVSDQFCSPTWVRELARAVRHLCQMKLSGTFHVVNRGAVSWFAFAQQILREVNGDCQLVPISSDQWGAAAPRPAYSVLNTSKYEATDGPRLSRIDDALRACLKSFRHDAEPEESGGPEDSGGSAGDSSPSRSRA